LRLAQFLIRLDKSIEHAYEQDHIIDEPDFSI
jgi:hypothetical protein